MTTKEHNVGIIWSWVCVKRDCVRERYFSAPRCLIDSNETSHHTRETFVLYIYVHIEKATFPLYSLAQLVLSISLLQTERKKKRCGSFVSSQKGEILLYLFCNCQLVEKKDIE